MKPSSLIRSSLAVTLSTLLAGCASTDLDVEGPARGAQTASADLTIAVYDTLGARRHHEATLVPVTTRLYALRGAAPELLSEVDGPTLTAAGLPPGRYRAEITRRDGNPPIKPMTNEFKLKGGARGTLDVVLSDTTGVRWTVAGFGIGAAALGVAYLIVSSIFRGHFCETAAAPEESGKTRVELALSR
jgi:hypothetical protein